MGSAKMAARGAKAVKGMKKAVTKAVHTSKLHVIIPAGRAAAAPPLGPQLGQRNINIAAFCKEFNERTKNTIEGTPLPVRVQSNPDRTFSLAIHQPTGSYLLRKAAGVKKGAMYPGKEVCGRLSLKHIYEIAKIKAQDPTNDTVPLRKICSLLIGQAHSCGIEVVREDLDPKELGQFLKERRKIVEEQENELFEAKQAKLMRL